MVSIVVKAGSAPSVGSTPGSARSAASPQSSDRVRQSCSSPDSPPARGGPTATSSPPAPGSECVVVDPGKDAAAGRRRGGPRARPQAGRGAAHPRPHRPHVVRRPGRRHLRRHRVDPPRRPAPARPTRWPGMSRETAAMLLGGKLRVRRARRRRASSRDGADARAGRPDVHRRPHPGPHRRARSPSGRRTTSRRRHPR